MSWLSSILWIQPAPIAIVSPCHTSSLNSQVKLREGHTIDFQKKMSGLSLKCYQNPKKMANDISYLHVLLTYPQILNKKGEISYNSCGKCFRYRLHVTFTLDVPRCNFSPPKPKSSSPLFHEVSSPLLK